MQASRGSQPNAPPMLMKDKVVVVAGGSRGMGASIAGLLVRSAATVVIASRGEAAGRAFAAELGQAASFHRLDVAREADWAALAADLLQRHGRIDALVNAAGVTPCTAIDDITESELDEALAVNLKGVLYGIAAALPHMKGQKSGHIINVASVAGHKVGPGGVVYAATKHGVRVISEGLRQEVKPYNIRSTIISPGAVDTELPDTITDGAVAAGIREVYKLAIPASSFARAVAFAMSQPEEVDINEILFRPTAQLY